MDGKRKILIVDDEQDILDFLRKSLQEKFEVSLSNNGAEALTMLDKNKFQLVLSDVCMPGIGGLELLQTIKKLSNTVEVILMTGYADTQVAIAAMDEGAFALVTKPLDIKKLLLRINHVITIIQNRENQEKVLKEMKNELLMQTLFSQRLSALAVMAGGIGHELNQPLSSIGLYAITLQTMIQKGNLNDTENMLKTLDKILLQVDRAAKVIEHMREFSSHSEDKGIANFNLKESVEKSLELFKVQLGSYGIELEIDIPPEMSIQACPNRLEQVILNLVANAKDSLIEKSLKSNMEQFKKHIFIKCHEDENWIIMDFIDSGMGVPKDLQKTLFNPFVTSKKNIMGSGLGLPICKRILQDFSAKIELKTTGSEGTTFRIRFPKQ